MEGWYSRLRERVPDGPMVRELIEAVEDLPGIDAWSHTQDIENRWTSIIAWGLALWMTRSLSGVQPLQQKIAEEIIALGSPDPDTFAELSGAGLCVAFGVVDGERIPRGKARTADWRLTWLSGPPVDVEVTTARQKDSHTRRQALAGELAEVLYGGHQECDLVVHIADPTVEEERGAVLAAAEGIRCGETQETLGKWQVRSQEIVRGPTDLLSGELDTRPSWWSADNARCFVLRGVLAGPKTRRAPAQVRVFFGVPYSSYINPIMKKADSPQGEAGRPFLVVVDIANLPAAFSEMPRALTGYLPFWKSISGILLYQDFKHVEKVGWLWRLINNPFAEVSLPEGLHHGRADLPNTMETGLRLTQEVDGRGIA
jgi:hypothetical protein